MVGPGIRRVFLRDMVLMAAIGIDSHEQGVHQRVRINVDLAVTEPGQGVGPDNIARVVDYAALADAVRTIVAAGHTKLAETLAERIAVACLVDSRALRVRVRVEKLDIFKDMASAGVEVERCRSSTTPA